MTAKPSALPTTKRDKIAYLLDHWDDIFNPPLASMNPVRGRGGDGLLPGMSRHHSVVELVRCLEVLRLEAPVQHAHLKAFHCAEWRTVKRPHLVIHKGKLRAIANPRPGREEDWDRTRERIVPGWVKAGKVRSAEERLAVLYRGQPKLPEELEDALLLSSEEIAEKERKRRAKTTVTA